MAGQLILPFALAYLAGSIPTSIIVCRALKGIDIRQHGSGNAGATNVYRVMGLKVALFVLTVDALKGAFGVFLPQIILQDANLLEKILGGFFAIAGHIWTVFAKFKGGKGIGPSLGVFLALTPVPALIALGFWVVVLLLTRIVSVASICAGADLAISSWLLFIMQKAGMELPLVYFTCAVALLIIITHRKNIARLLKGTENKISFGKRKNGQA
jgi:acyl phosphate:glycerol-3-phosphate acyltransferase